MFRLTAFAVFALACASPVFAASPYDDLLKHAPANTNAIVLIDATAAYASPFAKKEKWADSVRTSGHGVMGFVPADAERVVIAAEVNLTTMSRDFQVGLVKVNSLPNFRDLADQEGGTMVEIAGQVTTLSPRDVYFTSFAGSQFAAAYPADRQYVARWLKADKAGKLPTLTPQLRKAADASADNTVTIAVDLEDAADPTLLRFGLASSPIMVKNKGVNQFGLSVFLSWIKGLTFTAKVTDAVAGKIVIEFPEDVNRYKGILKDLFLELIDAYGVSIDGLDQWEATFTDTTVTLAGSMTSADLKRLVSLFSFPHPGEPEAKAAGNEPTAGATQRYLVAVDAVLAGIKKSKDSTNYEKTATWHDKAAAELEMISRRNVDPLAVEAAYQCSKRLRAIGASLRGVPIAMSEANDKAYVYSSGTPYWGWWGGGRRGVLRSLAFSPSYVDTNIPQLQQEVAKAIADDKKKRTDTWTAIDQLLSDTRRKLTDKYKVKF